ncbi:hypothetical protein KCV06_g107, partial [Aureobasidium melanogenum]
MLTALIGSGSSCCFFSSSKISAVWYGDDDQMMRRRGKARVSSTSLDCKSDACREPEPTPDDRSAKGSNSPTVRVHGTMTMFLPWRSDGRDDRNSRTSMTTLGGSAVATSRPPPAMRVLTVRKNDSCGSSPAGSCVKVTAIEPLSRISLISLLLHTSSIVHKVNSHIPVRVATSIHLDTSNESSVRLVHNDVSWLGLLKDVFVHVAIVGIGSARRLCTHRCGR